jgi:hypothetical protein
MRFEWLAGSGPYMAEFSDNDFELLPNESREIELNSRKSAPGQVVAGTLVVNAANAPEVRMAF